MQDLPNVIGIDPNTAPVHRIVQFIPMVRATSSYMLECQVVLSSHRNVGLRYPSLFKMGF